MKFRFHLRIALAAGVLLLCLPGHGLARLTGRPSPWVRRFLFLAGRALGLKVEVEGAMLRRDVLFVANHVSWLDILALGGATGAAFVSKDDVARWPVVGWLAREGGTIFVRRSNRGEVRGQADALGNALASGRPAALFPEGTTGDGITLLPFRASLLASVEGAPAPMRVQPVAIDYGAAARNIAWADSESAGDNARRILRSWRRLPVTLRFLPPIDPGALPDRKKIAAATRAAIEAALPPADCLDYTPAR